MKYLAEFHADILVRQGVSHHSRGLNCQDHAIARHSDHGVVLVVADGVSSVREGAERVPSNNEVGAWLAAEVAAGATLAALADGAVDDIPTRVGEAFHQTLGPLWTAIGKSRGRYGLVSTLLVAVVTDRVTKIWASGDGFWGVILPGDVDAAHGLDGAPGIECESLSVAGNNTYAGAEHAAGFRETATTAARRGATAVTEQLRQVLSFHGPVLAAHVATDGLVDEGDARRLVQRSLVARRATLEAMLTRPDHSDDLAVAWACSRAAALAGGR